MGVESGFCMAHALRTLLLLAVACGGESDPLAVEDVPVRVGMVAVDNRNVPVVVLEEQDGPRLLPIWIGTAEAHSIASEMESHQPPRPNTHDLARRLIQQLEAEVSRVVVTDLLSGTYYAILTLRAHGKTIEIDSRPSDAIAIALRTKAPIFVRSSLFEEAAEPSKPEAPKRQIEETDPEDAQPGGSSSATERLTL